MSDKENESMERDAMALVDKNYQIATRPSGSSLIRHSGGATVNNLQVNSSTINTTNYSLSGCSNLQIGNTFNIISWTPGSSQAPPQIQKCTSPSQQAEEAKVYKKTRTIAELMESKEQLNEQYLDIFSENFGDRYLQLPILLNIDDLFVKRMHVDHFQSGQSREVIYQILYHFFQEHQHFATVGWFAKFLWKNDFKKTVYNVNRRLKQLKTMNDAFDATNKVDDDEIEESSL